jgi:hypothetical protein
MIHFRKGTKILCGRKYEPGLQYSTNRKKVDCGRCILSLEVRDRKKVDKADKTNLKKLEKEVTALWRHAVWLIWGGHCALCGKVPPNDHNAHHFFTKGSHATTRYEPFVGVLLCYADHIGKVHRGGETEKVRDLLVAKIGTTLFEQMKARSYAIAKDVDLLKVKQYLEEFNRTMEVKEES